MTARVTMIDAQTRRGTYEVGRCRLEAAADLAALCGVGDIASLEGALFLDIETTSLGGGAGSFVFLLGVGSFVGDQFEVRQHVLEDPARETEFLDALDEEARAAKLLVTFHGRGFDLPRLEERCLLARRDFLLAGLPHIDLLVGARRIFRLRTGRVGLKQLEKMVLGVERLDDLPGAECPAAWYAYLRGETTLMDAALEHNLLDILSLPALAAALADAAMGRAPPHDVHCAGRVFGSAGARVRAIGLHRTAAAAATDNGLAARAHADAATLLRRCGDDAEAAEEARRACDADASLPGPWLQLAKHAEHALRDPGLALDYARNAERALFLRSASVRAREDLALRIARLTRKIEERGA